MNEQTNVDTYNPNASPAMDNDANTPKACANCGMPKEDWRGNGGQGFQLGENIYCCQGCATGTGCTCQ